MGAGEKKLAALSGEELEIAAMYFATSNLGQDVPKVLTPQTVRAAWRSCHDAHAAEQIDVGAELADWKAELGRRADQATLRMWAKMRPKFSGLPDVESSS